MLQSENEEMSTLPELNQIQLNGICRFIDWDLTGGVLHFQ